MPIDGELRREALEVLAEIASWEAGATRWDEVAALLDAMAEAEAADDPEALDAATAELEALSPWRAKEAGTTPKTPPPDPVRERLNETKHQITGRDDEATGSKDPL
ncbi:hypothetical protein BCD49_39155 [Pseudofrankia sp. EUN1h]|nr:hypothetical protein BCD49_39155 [Pseudofrankia sp. EUN1h]